MQPLMPLIMVYTESRIELLWNPDSPSVSRIPASRSLAKDHPLMLKLWAIGRGSRQCRKHGLDLPESGLDLLTWLLKRLDKKL